MRQTLEIVLGDAIMTLTYTQNMTKNVIKEIWFRLYGDTNHVCTCVTELMCTQKIYSIQNLF